MDEQTKVDKNTFKQIFKDWWDVFITAYPWYEWTGEIIQKILGCGDPANGFSTYVCPCCGNEKKVPFSCKTTFCLSCAKAYVDNWVEQIKCVLFDGVEYKHVVLTVPDSLRAYFHNKELLDEFVKCGIDMLNDFLRCCRKKDIEAGYIVVLQTAGRAGNWNPHLHIIMTAGGLTNDARWNNVNYMPFDMLHKKWQYYLFTMMKDRLSDDQDALELIDQLWDKYPNGIVAYIDKENIPTIDGLARYLAKYVVSPPIAVSRITEYDGQVVKYWYKDHKTNKEEMVELPALEFIERMVQHILPKGFKRIRYYGLHATCKVNKVRVLLNDIINGVDREIDPTKEPKKWRFRERVIKSYEKDPLICDKCGGDMMLWEIWHPDHGIIFSVENEAFKYGQETFENNGWGGDNLQLRLHQMWA